MRAERAVQILLNAFGTAGTENHSARLDRIIRARSGGAKTRV